MDKKGKYEMSFEAYEKLTSLDISLAGVKLSNDQKIQHLIWLYNLHQSK